MLNTVHTMQRTHLNITPGSMVHAVKVGKVTCQFTPFSVSPSSAQSFGIKFMQWKKEHIVLALWKRVYAHLCTAWQFTTCNEHSPQYYNRFHGPSSKKLVKGFQTNKSIHTVKKGAVSSHLRLNPSQHVTYILIYAMLDSSHNMQRSLNSILQQAPWSK